MSSLRLTLIVLLAVLVIGVPASASEPILDEDFEGGTSNVFSGGAWGMEELSEGHVGAGLRSIIPVGEHWGSSGHWYFSDHGLKDPEELYWRYWIKFDDGFYIDPPNRGKLPGPAGLYTYNCLGNRVSTADEPCWSARMLFSREYGPNGYVGSDDRTLLGFYAYHLDGPSNRGDIWGWDPQVALLDHGEWHCVEGQVSLNTPGSADGVLRGWVDGAEAFERTDLRFRRADEASIDIKSFWFDIYYGGDDSVRRNEIHFDSLALGSERLGCSDALTWDGTFLDDDGNAFEGDIEWLAASGITNGCNPPDNNRFCPTDPVTRGQMAAFLTRALELPPADRDWFSDDDGSTFEDAINRMAHAGITNGCNPPDNDRFCPGARITRAQMAAFLRRGYEGKLALGEPVEFVDDNRSIFEVDIEWLAATGVTRGCNPPAGDRFCPNDPVTRGQMAAFLRRANS